MKYLTTLGLCIAIAGVIGYAFGRFTTPTKIIMRDRVLEVVRTDQVIEELKKSFAEFEQKRDLERTITTVRRRDGTVVTREHDKEHTDTKKTDKTEETKHEDTKQVVTVEHVTEKIVERAGAGWRAGIHVEHWSGQGLDYGASVEKRILGPIWLGAEGFKSGRYGASLNLEF